MFSRGFKKYDFVAASTGRGKLETRVRKILNALY